MSRAIELLQSLIAAGVEFGTDGKTLRCRDANKQITPEIRDELAAAKAEIICFLSHKAKQQEHRSDSYNSDAEAYASALRQIGPSGYGPVARVLGWPIGKAASVEIELRKSGRLFYDRSGRGWLVEPGGKSDFGKAQA